MNSSNKHLKSKINEINNFIKTHNNPPKDLYDAFLIELKVSKLYIPGTFGEEEVNFEHLEAENGLMVLPLFTEPEEYSGENELGNFEFSFYAEIIADCGFEGCVINPNTDEIFVSKKFTEDMRVKELPDYDEDEIYDAYQLKDLAQSVKNESLVEFIRDDSNFNRFDELIELLSDSVLLNVVSSHEDLSDSAKDGILATLQVGGFNMAVKSEGMEKYGLLFTSLDAIRDTCDTEAGIHYYYQITSFDKILHVLLNHDLDGVIIDPYLNDYYIPRNVLLDIYENHPEIMFNPKYIGATFYSFLL